jgi:hypothetical protein
MGTLVQDDSILGGLREIRKGLCGDSKAPIAGLVNARLDKLSVRLFPSDRQQENRDLFVVP